MPVLIKSNGIAANTLGHLKTIGTTAIAEYNAYKARVLADGGVIKDEARTQAAFATLFDNMHYGNMAYFIAAWAGVKLDASGGVLKAYSLDGLDLNGKVKGAGELPKITGSYFTFATNSSLDNTKGGYLELSDSPYLAKKDEYAYFAQIPSATPNLSQPANIVVSGRVADGVPVGDLKMYLYDLREGGSLNTFFEGWALLLNGVAPTETSAVRIQRGVNKTAIVYIKANEAASKHTIYLQGIVGQSFTTRTQERFLHTKVAHTVGAALNPVGSNFGATPVTMAGAFTNISDQAARSFSSLVF